MNLLHQINKQNIFYTTGEKKNINTKYRSTMFKRNVKINFFKNKKRKENKTSSKVGLGK